MKIDIPADKAQTLKADDRGRINIGTEFANQEVEVVVLDEAKEPEQDELIDLGILLRRLERLENELHETEHNELREMASQIRMDVGDAAIKEAYQEIVERASEGDTLLFDEAGGNVENLTERENDE